MASKLVSTRTNLRNDVLSWRRKWEASRQTGKQAEMHIAWIYLEGSRFTPPPEMNPILL